MADGPLPELTPEEEELLQKHYDFYRALDLGERPPTTAAQKHFLAVCRGETQAETPHEMAYVKYRMKLARQRQQDPAGGSSGIGEYGEGIPKPGWFTDHDWKRMRGRYLSNSE